MRNDARLEKLEDEVIALRKTVDELHDMLLKQQRNLEDTDRRVSNMQYLSVVRELQRKDDA